MAESAQSAALQDSRAQRFAALYEPLRTDGYRYALYFLGDPEDAKDAMQDAALDAYSGLDRLRCPQRFRVWFFRILSVKCRRQMAKRIDRRSQLSFEDEFAEAHGSKDAEFVSALELREHLGSLGDDEREIILLAVVGGYSSSEIGALLHRPAGTVRARMSRALAKLREK